MGIQTNAIFKLHTMVTAKQIVKALVIAGNILFMLWILYNGFQEHFQGTLPEKISYLVLIGLLLANTVLLFTRKPTN